MEASSFDVALASTAGLENVSLKGAVSGRTYAEFLRMFPSTIWSAKHGKVLLTIWGSFPGLLAILYWRKRAARKRYQ
jgi:hypothetical protein